MGLIFPPLQVPSASVAHGSRFHRALRLLLGVVLLAARGRWECVHAQQHGAAGTGMQQTPLNGAATTTPLPWSSVPQQQNQQQQQQQQGGGAEVQRWYLDNSELEAFLRAYVDRCSHMARLYSIGRSVLGVPLYIGGVHGDEPLGRQLLLYLADWLCNNYPSHPLAREVVEGVELHLLPAMNPDGFTLHTRENANRVDLNRAFPDHWFAEMNAEEAGRQAEVRAVMRWTQRHHFSASASLHGGALVASYAWDGTKDKGYRPCPPQPCAAMHRPVPPCIALCCHASPCASMHRPVPPCIALCCHASPCASMHRPVPPCIALCRHASPCAAMHRPVPPCIALCLHASPCASMHRPVPPCIALCLHASPCASMHRPVPPCIALCLHASPCASMHRPSSTHYAASPDDATFRLMATTYATAHPSMALSRDFPGGITNGASWYPLYGGMQDWNYVEARCMEITLELHIAKWPSPFLLPQLWEEHRPALLALLTTTAKMGVQGTVLSAATSAPLPASIAVHGIDIQVMASKRFGDFYRLLPPGNYTVTISHAGHVNHTTNVTVLAGRPTLLHVLLRTSSPPSLHAPSIFQTRSLPPPPPHPSGLAAWLPWHWGSKRGDATEKQGVRKGGGQGGRAGGADDPSLVLPSRQQAAAAAAAGGVLSSDEVMWAVGMGSSAALAAAVVAVVLLGGLLMMVGHRRRRFLFSHRGLPLRSLPKV
ncbi:unnamed protein product [Closterium sp. NIES-64]|nr:unnamed protein product [Closterium sp. NIES-64]